MKSRLWFGAIALLLCTASNSAAAQSSSQQRMQACAQEWNGLKAANRTAGRNYRDFERECLARSAAGNPPSTVGVAPSQETPSVRPRSGNPVVSEGSSTVAEAQRQCPSDTVVWVNSSTKVYHFSGSRLFGHTKQGSYMCRGESDRAGFRAAKNERASVSR